MLAFLNLEEIFENTNEEKFIGGGGDSGEYRRQMSAENAKNDSGDNPPLIRTATDFTSPVVNTVDLSGYSDGRRQQSKSENPGDWTSEAPSRIIARSADRLISAEVSRAAEAARERTSANALRRRSRRQTEWGIERNRLPSRDLFGSDRTDDDGAKKRIPGSHHQSVGAPPIRSRVAAGMRYAGIGKRNTNDRSKVDAGMRYMGIGKRDY